MHRIAGAPVSSEAQKHVSQAEPPVEAGQVGTALAGRNCGIVLNR